MSELSELLEKFRKSTNNELGKKLSLQRNVKDKDVIELLNLIDFEQKEEASILLNLLINNYLAPKKTTSNKSLDEIYKTLTHLTLQNQNHNLDEFYVNFHLAMPENLRKMYLERMFNTIFHKKSSKYLERFMELSDRIDTFVKNEKTSVSESDPLAKAILDQDLHALNSLINTGIPLNEPFSNLSDPLLINRTPLMAVLQLDNDDMANSLLNIGEDLNINYYNPESITDKQESALSLAILKGKNDLAIKLLSFAEIDISIPNHKPLYNALMMGNFEIASLLIARGENLTREQTKSLINLSIKQHRYDLANYLLQNSATIDSSIMTNALAVATLRKDKSILYLLYQYGGKLETSNYERMLKTTSKDPDTQAFLLSCLPLNEGINEEHPLFKVAIRHLKAMASRKGDANYFAKLLIARLEDKSEESRSLADLFLPVMLANVTKKEFITILNQAISNNNQYAVEVLLKHKNFQFSYSEIYSLITQALNSHFDMAAFLHEHDVRFQTFSDFIDIFDEAVGKSMIKAFHSERYNQNVLRYIVTYANNFDISETQIIRNTLIIAKKNSQSPLMVMYLLQSGISPQKIFEQAVNLKNINAINTLIREGVGFEISPEIGYSALLLAIDAGQKDIVEWLISNGVNPKQNQSEVFMKAATARIPNSDVVNILLDSEANLMPQLLSVFSALDLFENTAENEYVNVSFRLLEAILNNSEKYQEFIAFINQHPETPTDEVRLKMQEMIAGSLREDHLAAFDILFHMSLLRKKDAESSMEDSLVRQANGHFESIVKSTYHEAFLKAPGNNDMSRIVAIERDIKDFILNAIIENCAADPDDNDNQTLVKFIHDNRTQLLDGNTSVMTQMRKLAVSNEDSAQIAWRGYDPNAPHDPRFPNLLTPQSSKQAIFSTQAATSEALNIESASEIVRKRVAYYFLAGPDKNVFLSQLADMRRAHEHPNLDSPTCFPGAIGRIARMGDGHRTLQLPPTRRDIMQNHVNAFIIKAYSDFLDNLSHEDQLKSYFALSMLTEANAKDILMDKVEFDESLMKIRNEFNKYLKSLELETSQMFKSIDEELNANGEPNITSIEIAYEIEYALTDLSSQGRSQELYKRLQSKLKQQETEKEVIGEPAVQVITEKGKGKEKAKEISNPYQLQINTILNGPLQGAILNQQLNKQLKKFIEFEITKDILYRVLANNDPERTEIIAKTLVDEAFGCDQELPVAEIIRQSFEQMRLQNFEELSEIKLSEEDEKYFKEELTHQSSFNGLSKKQSEAFKLKVESTFSQNPKLSEQLKKVCDDLKDTKSKAKRSKPLMLSQSAEEALPSKTMPDPTIHVSTTSRIKRQK